MLKFTHFVGLAVTDTDRSAYRHFMSMSTLVFVFVVSHAHGMVGATLALILIFGVRVTKC